MSKFNIQNPWHAGLIASTALSLVFFVAYLLAQSGHAEWAFCLMFVSAWLLLSLFWANDGYNEQSGLMLAEIMDHNLERLHSRISRLEENVQEIQLLAPGQSADTHSIPRLPVPRENWV